MTPEIRAAWPRVAGRWASSFCRISLLRLPTARVVQIGRQLQSLVPAVGGDVLALAGEIALVAGVDRQLLGNTAGNRRRAPATGSTSRAQSISG